MKKKITALLLLICLTLSVPVFAEAPISDPFSNDLFEVVGELPSLSDCPVDYNTYSTLSSSDFTQAKVIKITYDHSGNMNIKSITEMMSKDEADILVSQYNDSFNDGLKHAYSTETWTGTLQDVNGNVVYQNLGLSYFVYDYNFGLLRETSNNNDMMEYDPDNYVPKYYTEFTSVMTDNKIYAFEADFTSFDDNGYAIMQPNSDRKCYLVKLKKGIIVTVLYNGEKIKFDQIPVIDEGRTLVPLRAIFETLGASVDWNGETRTVTATKGDTTVALTIDAKEATKNGETVTLDVPAKIINGRTLVPVRFVSDCFGVGVEWDGTMKQVLLSE